MAASGSQKLNIKLVLKRYHEAKKEAFLGDNKFVHFDIEPVDDNFNEFYILIHFRNGIYANQTHILRMKLLYGRGSDMFCYPIHSPYITFLSPMYHTNVSVEGTICLDILKDNTKWQPTYGFKEIILSILLLLDDPNTSSPFNGEAGSHYTHCQHSYQQKIKGIKDLKTLEEIRTEVFSNYSDHANKYYKKNQSKLNFDLGNYIKYFPQIETGFRWTEEQQEKFIAMNEPSPAKLPEAAAPKGQEAQPAPALEEEQPSEQKSAASRFAKLAAIKKGSVAKK